MRNLILARRFSRAARLLLIGTAATMIGRAQVTETTIYTFTGGAMGREPNGKLISDAGGSLYGTASDGGAASAFCPGGCGVVFQLAPPITQGAAWTYNVLYTFQGYADGGAPTGPLTFDAQGNLYGTTRYGGAEVDGQYTGTVYELSPPASGGDPWTHTVIATFPAQSLGELPSGGVTLGPDGYLYGFTEQGGASASGIAFQLVPPAPGGTWTYNIIHNFNFLGDGQDPQGAPVIDSAGRIFGATVVGGDVPSATGAVFVLAQPVAGSGWSEKTIFSPEFAVDSLSLGSGGTLYAASTYGGLGTCIDACGSILQFHPPASPHGEWTEDFVYNFAGGRDGAWPASAPVVTQNGSLFGVTSEGGNNNAGTVYQLTPPSSPGGSWTKTLLHAFSGPDGRYPYDGLLAGPAVLYGITTLGGANQGGVIFEIH